MAAPFPGTGVPLEEHLARRRRVLDALGDDAMILASGRPRIYSRDTEYRFRPASDFFYLTGFPEPEAVLVLRPAAAAPVTLFVRPRDPKAEVWTGRRAGPEGAVADYGVDAAFPVAELDERLADLIDGARRLHYEPWLDAELDARVRAALGQLRGKERFGRVAPEALVDPGALLHEMRLVKSEAELAVLRRACEITGTGHAAAMRACRPGLHEYQLQNVLESHFLDHGAPAPGFATIVGGGDNACILHYVENTDELRAGEMVLVDGGAEYGGYNGDVTRTYPVDGRFTPAQRSLYDIVLAALETGIEATRPGATIDGIHERTLRVLTEGLVDLGLVEGPVDEALSDRRFERYFMHRTSHWLGMDVHDVGRYRRDGASRPLVPGMVITVEPGLYIPADDESAPSDLRGTGVRLEDDVLVTADGRENLTRAHVPVAPQEVEGLVGRDARR
ncbi:MAG: aminopeptidase P N-terminal domain-containing protein [Acidobacteriota bacterium]